MRAYYRFAKDVPAVAEVVDVVVIAGAFVVDVLVETIVVFGGAVLGPKAVGGCSGGC